MQTEDATDGLVEMHLASLAKHCPPHVSQSPSKRAFEPVLKAAAANLRADLTDEGVTYQRTNAICSNFKVQAEAIRSARETGIDIFEAQAEMLAREWAVQNEGDVDPPDAAVEGWIEQAKAKSGAFDQGLYTGDLGDIEQQVRERARGAPKAAESERQEALARQAAMDEEAKAESESEKAIADEAARKEKEREDALRRAESIDPSVVLARQMQASGIEGVTTFFPNLITSEVTDAKFGSMREAAAFAKERGIMIMPQELYGVHLADGLLHTGHSFIFDELKQAYLIRHRGYPAGADGEFIGEIKSLSQWEEVKSKGESSYPLTRARNAIFDTCMHIARNKAGNEFWLQRMKPKSWGGAVEVFQTFVSLRGVDMPVKNDISDFAVRMIEEIGQLDPDAINELAWSLDRVFLEIPGLKPSEGMEGLASHIGRYIYTMIGHRILQYHPYFKKGGEGERPTRPTREMPVILGAPGIGKSTIAEHILPDDFGFRTGKMRVSTDANAMGRAVLGNLLVVINELTGLRGNVERIEAVKAFMTEPTISVHRKFLDEVTIPMPCAFISTANSLELSGDSGLNVRIVPVEFKANNDDERVKGKSGEEKGMASIEYMKAGQMDWIKAGVMLAWFNVPFEATEALNAARLVALQRSTSSDDDVVEVIDRMIESGRFVDEADKPFITSAQVAWQLGMLSYPMDIKSPTGAIIKRLGEEISPAISVGTEYAPQEGDADVEGLTLRYATIEQAYRRESRSANAPMPRRISSAFARLGWVDKTDGLGFVKGKIEGHRERVRGWRPAADVKI